MHSVILYEIDLAFLFWRANGFAPDSTPLRQKSLFRNFEMEFCDWMDTWIDDKSDEEFGSNNDKIAKWIKFSDCAVHFMVNGNQEWIHLLE